MQSTGQRHHRDKLAKMLSRTTLLDVVGMTWSAWAIQNGHADHARRYMNFGPQATDGAAGAPFVLYPWQLETLVNEALASRHRPDARGRTLVTEQFSTILHLVKIVQRIEAADDRAFLQSHDVMYELHRLSQRQFEWQRGFANMPRFYRALDMFGHGAAGEHFEHRLGCTVPAFIEAGFFVFAGSSSSPTRVRSYIPPSRDADGHGQNPHVTEHRPLLKIMKSRVATWRRGSGQTFSEILAASHEHRPRLDWTRRTPRSIRDRRSEYGSSIPEPGPPSAGQKDSRRPILRQRCLASFYGGAEEQMGSSTEKLIESTGPSGITFIQDVAATDDFFGSHGRLAATIAGVIMHQHAMKVIGLLGPCPTCRLQRGYWRCAWRWAALWKPIIRAAGQRSSSARRRSRR